MLRAGVGRVRAMRAAVVEDVKAEPWAPAVAALPRDPSRPSSAARQPRPPAITASLAALAMATPFRELNKAAGMTPQTDHAEQKLKAAANIWWQLADRNGELALLLHNARLEELPSQKLPQRRAFVVLLSIQLQVHGPPLAA